MKRKGFTLVEILAAITVPMITKTINSAREGVAQTNTGYFTSGSSVD